MLSKKEESEVEVGVPCTKKNDEIENSAETEDKVHGG